MLPSRGPDDAKRKRSASSAPPPPPCSSSSHLCRCSSPVAPQRRRKWARLLLRELYDCGFRESAAALEREAAVQLRSPSMEKLQSLMGARQWDEALRLVTSGLRDADAEEGAHTERVRMKSPQATREAALLLLRRKFIDLLLQRRLAAGAAHVPGADSARLQAQRGGGGAAGPAAAVPGRGRDEAARAGSVAGRGAAAADRGAGQPGGDYPRGALRVS